jgi:predicted N-formylglutamate amidohydrolase
MAPSVPRSKVRLLLTCEHGGNRIPRECCALFRGAEAVLASHRGWDPGALVLARALGRRLRLPIYAVTWSRLLVESNRASTNRRIWSAWTASLPKQVKERILARYWWPHRQRVEEAVRSVLDDGDRVVHVAVHSFAPVLDGEQRNADVGLLYDPTRREEQNTFVTWAALLRKRVPGLRVRCNYPYRGAADGLPTWLRRRFPAKAYLGVELEVNQALLASQRRAELTRALGDILSMIY